jgi:hypothetical protein
MVDITECVCEETLVLSLATMQTADLPQDLSSIYHEAPDDIMELIVMQFSNVDGCGIGM